jgi:DNA mismatch repair protein MutS
VLHPLRDLDTLTQRQDMIAAFLDEPMLLSQVRTLLKEVRDLERTSSRLSQGSGNGRDLQALAVSLEVVPTLKRCSACGRFSAQIHGGQQIILNPNL